MNSFRAIVESNSNG